MKETIRGKLSETEAAYIAGLIDGEGSIGIYSYADGRGVSRLHVLSIVVTNNNPAVHEFLTAKFGGATRNRQPVPNWKPNYQWIIRNQKAADILEQIEPYLKLKRKQAKLGIQFIKTKAKHTVQKNGHRYGHPLTIQVINKRERFVQEMKILNAEFSNRKLQPQRLIEKTL